MQPETIFEQMETIDPVSATLLCKRGNVSMDLNLIQGNILGGFNKDHQLTILLKIVDPAAAVLALRPVDASGQPLSDGIFADVRNSSSAAVLTFNDQFRALRQDGFGEGVIQATWTNLAFTARGLTALNFPGVGSMPEAFKGVGPEGVYLGMAGRAETIGDINGNAPEHWNDGMPVEIDWKDVHAVLLLASDDPAQLDPAIPSSRAGRYLPVLDQASSGIAVLGIIPGETRSDDRGHEHFGFKDGVSQPGIRGIDAPFDPLHNPEQGNPGQDLLQPGEFLIGYPRQIPVAEPQFPSGPNRCQGAISGLQCYPSDPDGSKTLLPEWTFNGSFLVFRRLAQDVLGFRTAVSDIAASLGITEDLLGAKLVGRYKSGAPLEALKFETGIGQYQPPLDDPGKNSPRAASNSINNYFEYEADEDGVIVPLAAHIRKAYPRDQAPEQEAGVHPTNPDDAESRTQTHRLLRRGIPFGKSTDEVRGLLFFAYQSDIERQFEFVQRFWIDDPNFPKPGAGSDPLLSNNTTQGALTGCPFHPTGNAAACPVTFHRFVKTRGGQYFFAPSINALNTFLVTHAGK